MGCCGRGGSNRTAPVNRTAARAFDELPGQAGMVVLEYTGENAAEMTFWGEETRTPYRFGGSRRKGYVDVRDVDAFLDVMEGRLPVFRRVVIKKTKPVSEEYTAPVEVKEEKEQPESVFSLSDVAGMSDAIVEGLVQAGYKTLADIAGADIVDLTQIKGIGPKKAEALVEHARQ